jgi:3-hydroxyisobutyrate dehydrogenase
MSTPGKDGPETPDEEVCASMPIAFVGLGNMGLPMAVALTAAGFSVTAYDIAENGRRRAEERGIAVSEDLAGAAAGAKVGILMLPGSDIVDAVVDQGGFARLLAADAVCIDMSSSEPLRTRALAERVRRDGRRLLDAPVSGGVRGAEAHALTIMVGGEAGTVEEVRSVLQTFGRVVHVGGIGTGHALKALNNLLSASHLWATSEAVLVARQIGIDPTVFLAVVNTSTGRSWSSEHKWPDLILPGTYESGFSLALLRKDLGIAARLGKASNVPMLLGAEVAALFERAGRGLPTDADHTEIARWLETHTATPDGTEPPTTDQG